MTPSREMMATLLEKQSATEVHAQLRSGGYEISRQRLVDLRRDLMRTGDAIPLRGAPTEVSSAATERSCAELQHKIEQMYARRAVALGTTPDAVKLALNYSRAQLLRMAA